MTALRRYGRRLFLTDLGKGTIAVAALGVGIACSDDDPQPPANSTAPPPIATEPTQPDATPAPTTATTVATAAPAGTVAPTTAVAELAAVDWSRVVLGNVSAYALVRAGEAAIVDTGTSGSAGSIEAALAAAGLGWDTVGHVVVTHSHGDHIGSLPNVLGRAPDATAYAGAGDIARITSPRPLVSVGDGDRASGSTSSRRRATRRGISA